MATIRLPYVNSFRDRHGRMRHYFRRGGASEPLPAPGTLGFSEAYEDCLARLGPKTAGKRIGAEGTLAWVIDRYFASDGFTKELKPSTRLVYERILGWLREKYGRAEFASLKEHNVRKIRNELRERPSVADRTVDKIGMLWRFAKEDLEIRDLGPDPSREVAGIHSKSNPHPAWPPELCRLFEDRASPRLLRAYFLLRYTGQRRSDVVAMTRKRFDGSGIEVVQEKTGTYVWIPAHKRLREHLSELGIEGDYLLLSSWGTPYKATSLTNQICDLCTELGYRGHSPHGLRHLAGSALAEAGCTSREIMSILGHLTEREAAGYVQQANRKVMAVNAMGKWEKRDD
jgi:integrase